MKDSTLDDRPRVTYGTLAKVLYNIFSFLDGYDVQTLSLCMRAFEVSLGLSPSSLSMMATVDMMAFLGFCPFWGFLADRFPSNYVLGTAISLAGLSCILIAVASNYGFIIFLRLLHGFAMSCSAPVIQKVITDSNDKNSRATHFGVYHSIACLGRLVSSVVTTFLSMMIIMGFYGWRVCYFVSGIIWLVMAVLVIFFMKAQPVEVYDSEDNLVPAPKVFGPSLWYTLKTSFKTETSWILLLAVFISDAAFSGLVYLIMYLQYTGLSDLMAGVVAAIGLVGGVIGGIAGGYLVDYFHKRYRDFGRITVGTLSIVVRIIFGMVFFMAPMPSGGQFFWYHYVSMVIMSATLMTVSTIDRPILSDIVPKDTQASANALNRSVAGIPSSIVFVTLAGFLAESCFGYVKSSDKVADMAEAVKLANATALRKSMLYILVGGSLINIALYVMFYFTYPKDRDMVAQEELRKEQEAKDLEERPAGMQKSEAGETPAAEAQQTTEPESIPEIPQIEVQTPKEEKES